MTEALPKILLPLSAVLGGLFVFYRVIAGSASSNGYMYLGGLIGLEILFNGGMELPGAIFPGLAPDVSVRRHSSSFARCLHYGPVGCPGGGCDCRICTLYEKSQS